MTLPAERRAEPVHDETLIVQIARGDLEALGSLFDRHEREIRAYVCRLGMSPSDCDDIVQSVFIEIMKSAGRFDPRLPARAWVYGIATMLVRRERRSLSRQAARLMRWAREKVEAEVQSPEECHRSDRARVSFERAYAGLSSKKKEVFALVVLQGLSGEQAARTLGIPVGTVWTRLHHAREELRRAVEGGDA